MGYFIRKLGFGLVLVLFFNIGIGALAAHSSGDSEAPVQRWIFRSQQVLSAVEAARTARYFQDRLLWLTGKSWPLSVAPTSQEKFLFTLTAPPTALTALQLQRLLSSQALQWKVKTDKAIWVDGAIESQYLEQIDAQYAQGQWQIRLQYQGLGVKQMAQFTRQQVHQTLGIFVGERLISSPMLQEPILGVRP